MAKIKSCLENLIKKLDSPVSISKKIKSGIKYATLVSLMIAGSYGLAKADNKKLDEKLLKHTKIAFLSGYGRKQLCVMNADGSEKKQLTDPDWYVEVPSSLSWSPDGKKIIFLKSGLKSNSDIYTINSDGSDKRNLTLTLLTEGCPVWSPDGKKIAFKVERYRIDTSEDMRIKVMNADGSDSKRIRILEGRGSYKWLGPQWFPDSKRILVPTNRTYKGSVCNYNISIANVRDGNIQKFRLDKTRNDIYIQDLVLSSNGKRMAFTEYEGYDYRLCISNPDGNNFEEILEWPHYIRQICWSPNSKKLAFVSDKGGSGIYVINSDGGNLKKIARGALGISWSPDSRKIVFATDKSNKHNKIYIVNTNGRGLKRLTYDGENICPKWSPFIKK